MQGTPEISVIIPTHNRSTSLWETLTALSVQTMDPSRYEVIVVNDGSTDDTEERVKAFTIEFPSLCLRYERHVVNRLKAAACNTGILVARGDLVVFTDDDIRPVKGWLQAHVSRHRSENRTVSVTGLVLYPEEWEKRSNWVRFANGNYRKNEVFGTEGLPPNRFAGGNTSMPRELVISAGMFNEKSRRLEDVDLGCRLHLLGVPLVFERSARVYHHAEAIQSIEGTLRSFRRSYEFDRPTMREEYPWFYQEHGHWFLEPFDASYDNTRRWLAKMLVRSIAHRPMQRMLVRLLQWLDGTPWLYWRPLYQYVLACEALDAIRVSERTPRQRKNEN